MSNIDYTQFLNLIPPALAIAIFAYFVNFFGKVIADQYPFADDRKWQIQLSGGMFMLNVIFGGVLGVFLANKIPLGTGHWWSHFITLLVFAFIGSALLFNNQRESARIYSYKKASYEAMDKKLDGLVSWYAKIGHYIFAGTLPVVVIYFATLEYFSKNPYWIGITFIIGFYIFFWSAFQESLRKTEEYEPVDIYFNNKEREPMLQVIILKVNEDNLRIREGNTIVILNKLEVFEIKMNIPERLR